MKIFDEYIAKTCSVLKQEFGVWASAGSDCDDKLKSQLDDEFKVTSQLDDACGNIEPWHLTDKTPFIMERDTAIELGGYPKDSINMVLSTSSELTIKGLHIINTDSVENHVLQECIAGKPLEKTGTAKKGLTAGLTKSETKHISFGKLVFLKVNDNANALSDESAKVERHESGEDEKGSNSFDLYDFLQSVQMAELRFKPTDVMQRTSGEQFLTNYKVSKKAVADGFTLQKMGAAMIEHFKSLEYVEDVAVVLVIGDSEIYGKLRPLAEDVKRISITLNNKFDGIDMDCGSCSMSPICDEVEELRDLHRSKIKK